MQLTPHQAALAQAREIDVLCSQFEARWLADKEARLEDVLGSAPAALRADLLRALLAVELELFAREGKLVTEADYRVRFPQDAEVVGGVFAELASRRAGAETSASGSAGGETGSHRGSSPRAAPEQGAPAPAAIGRYQILQVLGQGAFGTVYRARDPQLEREVALKVPRAGALEGERDVERFLREARAAATIHHPNICPIYEVGNEPGNYFLVMGLVPGSSLADHLAQRQGPLPQKQAALIIRKLALALEAAHAKGVIHRDLKPSNIMLDVERNEPVITDFGMARRLKSADTRLTQSGVVMGTPAYMSPEQAGGGARAVGPASDIFALGVILYELLAGKRPFSGSVTEVLGQILYASIEPPSTHRPGLHPQLQAVCLKAMARDPKDRYPSMKALAADLTKAVRALDAKPERVASANPPTEAATRSAHPHGHPLSPLLDALQAMGRDQAGRFRRFSLSVVAGLAAVVLLLAAIIFFARTPTATVLISVDVDLTDKTLSFFLDGKEIPAEKLAAPVELKVGDHELVVMRGQGDFRRYRGVVVGGRNPGIQFIEIRPGTADRKDADRRAAEWVIGMGGWVHIDADNRRRDAQALNELPAGSFRIIGINLWGKDVDDKGVEHLRGLTHVQGLVLFGARLTAQGMKSLRGMTELQSLDLGTVPVTDSGLESLKGMTKLEIIFLTRSPITDAGLEHLKAATNLRELYLNETGVGDAALERLKRFPHLTVLWLAGSKVSDDGLKHLAGLKRLGGRPKDNPDAPGLDLGNTRITDAGLENVKRLKGLVHLNLKGAKVTAAGVKRLADALPSCKIVSDHGTFGPVSAGNPDRKAAEWVLSVGGEVRVASGDQVSGPIRTGGTLPTGPFTLHTVLLPDDAKVRDEGELSRLAGLTTLRVLNLQRDLQYTDATLELARGLTGLEALWFEDANRLTDAGLANLAGLPRLRSVALCSPQVTDAGLESLARIRDLRELRLDTGSVFGHTVGFPKVTARGLAHLKHAQHLEELHLRLVPVDAAGLAQLKELRSVRKLILSGPGITNEGCVHLVEMADLVLLRLQNSEVTDAAVPHLTKLTKLIELDVSNSKLTPAGLRALKAALPNCHVSPAPKP